jgi:predicted lipoprotein with Yx(FWY)xxD motif
VEIRRAPNLTDGAVRRGRNGPARLRVLLGLSAAAAATSVLVACSSAGTSAAPSSGGTAGSSPAAAAASTVTTVKIGGATVLASSKGFTLYSFGPDTPTKSNCNGTCAQNWPPEKGPVTAVGITTPGQAKGNGLNAAGGVWHEIILSGVAAPASGGGGNGY